MSWALAQIVSGWVSVFTEALSGYNLGVGCLVAIALVMVCTLEADGCR
ncbi:MAG: hypothetical protein AAGJ80_02435 [Cyanobacteria bacterium J06553_1]